MVVETTLQRDTLEEGLVILEIGILSALSRVNSERVLMRCANQCRV